MRRYYGFPDNPVYPGTNVLMNRFNVRRVDELEVIERSYTTIRESELINVPMPGDFDTSHIRNIHKYLFQDVYLWAGQLRRVDVRKGNTIFCAPSDILESLNKMSIQIQRMDVSYGMPKDDLCDCLTEVFSSLNMIHPFREGNGRTQRIFLGYLASSAGYDLDMYHVTDNGMRRLSEMAARDDKRLMRSAVYESLHALPGQTETIVTPVQTDFDDEYGGR